MKCCHPSVTGPLAQCSREQAGKKPHFSSVSRRIRIDFMQKGRRAAGFSTSLDLVVSVQSSSLKVNCFSLRQTQSVCAEIMLKQIQ
jgi:hypothetical protein